MHKSCPVQIKAAGTDDGLEEGQFRAVVSVFNNVDSYGDMVMPGAFADTLKSWAESGDPIPVYWSHRMDDPDFNIGYVISASETDQGLEVLAQLDQGADASSKAAQVYRLLKGRRVSQFSFAYDVVEQGQVEKDGETYNELRALKLHEVGPTPVGANSETELLAVKAAAQLDIERPEWRAELKAQLEAVLTALKGGVAPYTFVPTIATTSTTSNSYTITTPSAASDAGPVKDEEPEGAKSEEPSRRSSVQLVDLDITLIEHEGRRS